MSNFCPDQGRTRVCGEAYVLYAATQKPAENAEQGKKGHLWMDNNEHSKKPQVKDVDF